MNLEIFSRMVRKIYPSVECSYSLEEVLMVFSCFFDEYKRHTGKPHPPISKATAERIIKAMPFTEEGYIEPNAYADLIRSYFRTKFHDGCDYRIAHFFSGDIRQKRFYEVFQ